MIGIIPWRVVMKRIFCFISVLVLLFAVISCGSKKKVKPNEEGNKPLPEQEVSKEISAEEGGTVETEDESVMIEIPAGALENDTTITMKVYDAKGYPGTEGQTVISKVVEFEPSGTIFKKPVTISMISTGTEGLTRAAKKKVVTAAVYREEKGEWSYSPTGVAVKITKEAGGDPIMTSAAGDPIMLNAAGDPIMMNAAGDPIMLSAAGDPIMVTAAGDPIMTSAAGDPIMMTTGHFTAYAFFYIYLEEAEPVEEPEDDETTDEDDDIVEISDEDDDIDTSDIEISEDDDEIPDEIEDDVVIPDEDEDIIVPEPEPELFYSKVFCTGMTICTDEEGSQILCPEEENDFYGQDAQYAVRGSCVPNHNMKEVMKPEVLENDFVEVKDDNTGLTWLYIGVKGTYEGVANGCDISYGGKEDWRFPTPKELMTLAWNDRLFRGVPADPILFKKVIDDGLNSSSYSDKYGIYLWSSIENYIYALEYGMTVPPKAYESYQSVFYDGILMCVSGEEYGKVNADNYASITRSGDEMVFDSSTNLYWQKDSGKAETWKEALNYCENLEYAGFSDWRLPNKNELVTLIDHSKIATVSGNSNSSSIPGEGVYTTKSAEPKALSAESGIPSSFPGMKADVFWSSTSAGEYKWVVDMTDGTAYTFNGKTAGGFYIMRHSELPISVRCVRSKLDEKADFPACNESGVAPCQAADGTIWSSVIYPEIFVDFDKSYISSYDDYDDDGSECYNCRSNTRSVDMIYTWDVAEMCRSLREKGSNKWRLPTLDEIRSIVTSENLKKDGNCGVTNECFDGSCGSEETCTDEPSQTLLYDFGAMISATFNSSDNYDYQLWILSTEYGNLGSSSNLPVSMLFQRCVLDESLPYEKAPYTDPEGIKWSDISSGYLNLQDAEDYCYELSKGDLDNWWRMPTLDEVKTLVRNCSEEDTSCPVDVTGKYSLFGDIDYLWAADNDEELYWVDFSNADISSTGASDHNRVRCVSDGSNPCADDPCNGLARCNVVENNGVRTHECICPDFYEWNGSICASICSTDPCGSVLHSNGLCTPTSDTTYKCGCASGYYWSGSACVNPCDADPCGQENGNECSAANATEYECGCNEDNGYYLQETETETGTMQGCVNPCAGDPCNETSANSTGDCTAKSATEYECSCDEEAQFYWRGMTDGCQTSCSGDPCADQSVQSTGTCTPISEEEYECSCDEDHFYFWRWSAKKCVMQS